MKRIVLLALVVATVSAVPLARAAGDDWKAQIASIPAVDRVQVVGSGALLKDVNVRTAPSASAPVVVRMKQFRKDFRPQYVLATRRRIDAVSGKPAWYRITVPGRPNGRTGWIPAAAVDLKPVDRWLVIHRGERSFSFYVRGKLVRRGMVAVGAKGMETPLGLFYVQWRFDPTWEVLGAYAFETSGYSKLSEWPGGGVVGVHGTNTPQLLGQAVSHGCVRLHNDDVNYLRAVVRIGTPVKISA